MECERPWEAHSSDQWAGYRFCRCPYPRMPTTYPHERRPPWAIGPQISVEHAKSACLALMGQETGLAFDGDWLTRKLPAYRTPDPYRLLRNVPGIDLL